MKRKPAQKMKNGWSIFVDAGLRRLGRQSSERNVVVTAEKTFWVKARKSIYRRRNRVHGIAYKR